MEKPQKIRLLGGLTGKVVMLVAAFGLVLGALLPYSYVSSSRIAVQNAEERFHNLAVYLASQLMIDLTAVSEVANEVARFVEAANPNEPTLLVLLRSVVHKGGHIYGSTVAYEPYAFSKETKETKETKEYSPYFYRRGGTLHYIQLGNEQYNYLARNWYVEPKKSERPTWSEPYWDRGVGMFSWLHTPLPSSLPTPMGSSSFAEWSLRIYPLNGSQDGLENFEQKKAASASLFPFGATSWYRPRVSSHQQDPSSV